MNDTQDRLCCFPNYFRVASLSLSVSVPLFVGNRHLVRLHLPRLSCGSKVTRSTYASVWFCQLVYKVPRPQAKPVEATAPEACIVMSQHDRHMLL